MKHQFWTAPNQLTLLRLLFIPFVIINVFDGNWGWALGLLIAAGLSDGLDGLLARVLNQQTMLGEYLDPIADKLLLSSLFLVLSFVKKIRGSTPSSCSAATLLLFRPVSCSTRRLGCATSGRASLARPVRSARSLRCSSWPAQVSSLPWIALAERLFLYATFAFATVSGVHYVLRTGYRLRHPEPRSTVVRNAS